MVAKRIHAFIAAFVRKLQLFVDRLWYPPILGLICTIDFFAIVLPTDGLLVSSSMLRPRRWFSIAIWMAVGSTIGALVLAAAVELKGLPWALQMYPGIDETRTWQWAVQFFDSYGMLVVFAVAASPFFQQPTVIIAALANTPLWKLTAVVFGGRVIKFLVLSYLASHAPKFIPKIWGLQGELREVGVNTDADAKMNDKSSSR